MVKATIGSTTTSMSNQTASQINNLAAQALMFSTTSGQKVVENYQTHSSLLLAWLAHLSNTQQTGTANALLEGACSAVREVAACLSLGMIRPALFSLRTQIDLVLGWIYFKDHPIEWNNVNTHGDGFILKREVIEYIYANFKGSRERFVVLREGATRKTDEPYRLLSAHVHAQSTPALPANVNLSDVVSNEKSCMECGRMAQEVSEYLSDILAALYAPNWMAIPQPIQKSVTDRLVKIKQGKARFFSGI
jgi:hypothetical protein